MTILFARQRDVEFGFQFTSVVPLCSWQCMVLDVWLDVNDVLRVILYLLRVNFGASAELLDSDTQLCICAYMYNHQMCGCDKATFLHSYLVCMCVINKEFVSV